MKLHLPLSLLAAVTLAFLGAGQAWAETYTDRDANSDGTNDTRTFSGSGNTNMLNAEIPSDISTVEFALNSATSDNDNWLHTGTYNKNVLITDSQTSNDTTTTGLGLHLRNGGAGTVWFKGSLSGDGSLSKTGAGTNMHLLFTGDAHTYTGNIELSASNNFFLEFGGQANGHEQNLSGTVDAGTNNSTNTQGVSGTGSITFKSNVNTLIYNYDTDNTAYVTNAISTDSGKTSTLIIAGSSAMEFTQSVAVSTLTIADDAVDTAAVTLTSGNINTISGTAGSFTKSGTGELTIGDFGKNTLSVTEGTFSGSIDEGRVEMDGGKLGTFSLTGGTLNLGTLSTDGSGVSYTNSLTMTSGSLELDNLNELLSTPQENTTMTLLSGSSNLGAVDWTQFDLNDRYIRSDGSTVMTSGSNSYALVLGTSEGNVTLNISALDTVTWSAGANGVWQAGDSENWGGETYTDDKMAIFGTNSGNAEVSISGEVQPNAFRVDNGGTYTFVAADASTVGISGNAIAEVSGNLTIDMQNEAWDGFVYVLNGGRLTVNNEEAVGSSRISLLGGTINKAYTAGDLTVYVDDGVTVSTDNLLVAGGTLTLEGKREITFSKMQHSQAGDLVLNVDANYTANNHTMSTNGNGAIEIATGKTLSILGVDAYNWAERMALRVKGTLAMDERNTVSDLHTINLENGGSITGGSFHYNVEANGGNDAFVINAKGNSTMSSDVFASGATKTTQFNVEENGRFTMSGSLMDRSQSGTSEGTFKKTGLGTMVFNGQLKATTHFLVEEGTLEFAGQNALLNNAKYQVAQNAVLDTKGWNNEEWTLTLAGGTLTNTGNNMSTESRGLKGITLTADSVVTGTGNINVIANAYGNTTLALGSHTLTKTGSNTFYLKNTTISADEGGKIKVLDGTLEIQRGGEFTLGGAALELGGDAILKLSGNGTLSVNNLTISEQGSLNVTSGSTLSLTGSIKLNVNLSDLIESTTATTVLNDQEYRHFTFNSISGATLDSLTKLEIDQINWGSLWDASQLEDQYVAITFSGIKGLTTETFNADNFSLGYCGWNATLDGVTFSGDASNGSITMYVTIPEPTTATLSLLALAGLAARRRRK